MSNTNPVIFIAAASDQEYGNPVYSTMAVFSTIAEAVAYCKAEDPEGDEYAIWSGSNGSGFIQYADGNGTPWASY